MSHIPTSHSTLWQLLPLTNEKLLQFLITVVDTELFKAVLFKYLKTINVKDTDDSVVLVAGSNTFIANLNGIVHPLHDEREEPLVDGLKNSLDSGSA